MTFDLQDVLALCGGTLVLGGQLAILQQVVRSNRDQGQRIGKLEDWKAAQIAVAKYRDHRTLSRAHGVPVVDEDVTPP